MAESFEFVLDEEQPTPTKEQLRESHARLVRWAFAGDAVEVVRCKDCKRCAEKENASYKGFFCERMVDFMQPDDFCSYGERRADDEV